ncbi:MAG TPA: hypothetical protein VGA68_03180 [Woeseiaceae bacterium]
MAAAVIQYLAPIRDRALQNEIRELLERSLRRDDDAIKGITSFVRQSHDQAASGGA